MCEMAMNSSNHEKEKCAPLKPLAKDEGRSRFGGNVVEEWRKKAVPTPNLSFTPKRQTSELCEVVPVEEKVESLKRV